MLGEKVADYIQIGASGRPFAFGMDGRPASLDDAAELHADMERRTLRKTEITLPGGVPAVVRTLCLVYDHDLAVCAPHALPAGYVPEVFASAVYWGGDDLKQFFQPLWTYHTPEEAMAAHCEAVDEFVSGRARVKA